MLVRDCMSAPISAPAPAGVTAAEFKTAGRHFASGVTVVTTRHDELVHGATVFGLLHPVARPATGADLAGVHGSVDPPDSRAGRFAVSVLAADQEAVSRAFSSPARPGQHGPFADVDSVAAVTGAPILAGCLAYFDCTVGSAVESGDHTVFVGNVQAVGSRDGQPLVYFDGAYRALRGDDAALQGGS